MKIIFSLFFILIICFIVSLSIGQYNFSIVDVVNFFLYKLGFIEVENNILLENIFVEIRLPRIIAAILIGASLSISGVAFQSMFKNPLVSPRSRDTFFFRKVRLESILH